ncbi:MAG: hypothetical protein EHM88_03395 [Candidatus Rokuibacteriota bacterium]|nr:MAG: hypothetical protein EHM88_03395 [Candidatus Rokubacteria bacterium]
MTSETILAGTLEVGDHLDRNLWPFTIAKVERFNGGYDGRQPLVRLTSTAGERFTLLSDHRMTIPVIRCARRSGRCPNHPERPSALESAAGFCQACCAEAARAEADRRQGTWREADRRQGSLSDRSLSVAEDMAGEKLR